MHVRTADGLKLLQGQILRPQRVINATHPEQVADQLGMVRKQGPVRERETGSEHTTHKLVHPTPPCTVTNHFPSVVEQCIDNLF